MQLSMFFFARLVDRLTDLQITNVLQFVGHRGRAVIRAMFNESDGGAETESNAAQWHADDVPHGLTTQTLKYSGYPLSVTELDTKSLIDWAERGEAIIEMVAVVGDTLVEGSIVLRMHGGNGKMAQAGRSRPCRGRLGTGPMTVVERIRRSATPATQAALPAQSSWAWGGNASWQPREGQG